LDVTREQQLVGHPGELPPRSHVTGGTAPGALLDQLDAVVEDLRFLVGCHRKWVLVTVAVDIDLVACSATGVELLWEGFDGMSGPEPGARDPGTAKQLEHARNTHLAREHPS